MNLSDLRPVGQRTHRDGSHIRVSRTTREAIDAVKAVSPGCSYDLIVYFALLVLTNWAMERGMIHAPLFHVAEEPFQ
ncbi:MAG TPA: hypothetical protein VFW89_04155 [Gemmatimonadaceae bacterium]|nr:hypothetical protein [Gemmatimonadaceae bacterium]